MKRRTHFTAATILVIFLCFGILSACGTTNALKKEVSEISVIELTYGAVFGIPEETDAKYYTITDDKQLTITYPLREYLPDSVLKKPTASRQLSDEEYKTLLSMIEKNKILEMPEDLTDHMIMDGGYYYLKFIMNDGNEYTIGGCNPYKYKKFMDVVGYINDFSNEDMQKELRLKTDQYVAVFNQMPLYYTYYEQIEECGLTVTEEQLEKISNIAMFFCDMDMFRSWFFLNSYNFDPETGLYTPKEEFEGGNYAFKPIKTDGNMEIYIDSVLIGTIEMTDMTEIYKEEIETYRLIVTEEQLRSAGIQFFSDLNCISKQNYAFLDDIKWEYFGEQEKHDLRITVNSKEIDNTVENPCPAYRFEMENGKWNFYIGNDKVGEMEYVSPFVYFADEIAEFNVHCSEECFFEECFNNIFSSAEQIKNHDDWMWHCTYDEEADIYRSKGTEDEEITYYYSGDSNGNYDIIYRGDVIGSFTVSEKAK